MMYNELVESCFFYPKHVGTLALSEPFTVSCRTGEVGRGDYFDIYLLCNKEGAILKACFKAYGSPYLIAGLELLCQQLEESKIDEHPQLDYSWFVEKLGIPQTRYPVALLVEDGYREIISIMRIKLRGNTND